MDRDETYDVLVVGSGAAGAAAALRAADLGLSVLIVEKAPKFGGTSATSGGVLWVPNHGLGGDDSRSQALTYLDAIITDAVRRDRLEAYIDQAPALVGFLKETGVDLTVSTWPDYFPDAPGARSDRAILCPTFDGRRLGRMFPLMREQYARFKLLNRYAMDIGETFTILARARGWPVTVARVIGRYWSDLSTRRLSKRDRRYTIGAALMGAVYEQVFARGVEVRLDTGIEELLLDGDTVSGITVSSFGRRYAIGARHGVVIAAGGFEWNQALRDRFFTVPGLANNSSSPEGANRGEALLAGLAIGADTEYTETGWWIPTMQIPMPEASNFEQTHQAAFDVGRPHSVCVNRLGHRFVDEACGYDRFGKAMMEDQLATGANTPCWLVFDATFRAKFTAGGLLPSLLMPDRKVPVDWWDHYLFRADTIAALAAKIHVPADALAKTVADMNAYAGSGIDPQFGRGSDAYDRMFGDASVAPNPCLGPIGKAPFYAVPIQLGDLGTKGGLKADAQARVLDRAGRPIPGLYAAGNASGSPFGHCYPGAGATIGPAMTFGFVAANHIHARSGNRAGLS